MYGVGFGYGAIGATTILKSGVATDADAASFFTTAGITDATQKNAVNQLVLDLKSNNLWTKIKALYPVVGGNATAHSYNLKNTTQFQLSFSSGWTHASTGMKPNGTSAFANTGFNPFQQSLSINSSHVSYYRRNVSTGTLIGSLTNAGTVVRFTLTPDYGSGYGNISEIISTNAQQQSTAITDLGLISGNRNSSTSFKLFANSTLKQTVTRTSTVQPDNSFYIGANHENTAATAYNSGECSFASIGDGLTDTDVTNLYTAVQAFQTTLSRQV